jgi:hypothetical protein
MPNTTVGTSLAFDVQLSRRSESVPPCTAGIVQDHSRVPDECMHSPLMGLVPKLGHILRPVSGTFGSNGAAFGSLSARAPVSAASR